MNGASPAAAPVLALLCALAVGVSDAAATAPSQTQEGTRSDELRATVQSVDMEATTLDVITGVGYALKEIRIECDDRTNIIVDDEPSGMAELEPGDVVSIELRPGAEAYVADRVERVESGGRR